MVQGRLVVWPMALLVVLGGCTAAREQTGGSGPDRPGEQVTGRGGDAAAGQERGEGRKRWSGISYAEVTRVSAAPSPSMLAPGFDAERVWGGHDDWEPAIAVDPSSSNVYQMVTRYGPTCPGCPDPVLAFRRSTDGGATWEADRYVIPSKRAQNDPQLEVAEDGTIYAAFMLDYRPGVSFSKSHDRGATWTAPRRVAGRHQPRWSDKPVLVISPDGQNIYIAFNASHSYVAVSRDRGERFAAPVQTSHDGRYWFHFQGAVGPDGKVCFAAVDYGQDYDGAQNIQVLCSRDQGRSWATRRLDTSAAPVECAWADGCYTGYFGAAAGLAIDSAGAIMVAYTASDSDGASPRLYARTSADGETWSERQRLSVDDADVINAFPVVAAGPTPGDFRISWQDDRSEPARWNTWYKRTEDAGRTWREDLRLSDQSEGAPYKRPQGYYFPYGDYHEIAVDRSGLTHIIWGESTSYTGPGGAWYTRGL